MKESEPNRGDALDFVDDLLAEEEQARIQALPPNVLHAEMNVAGIDRMRAHALVRKVLASEIPADKALPKSIGWLAGPYPKRVISLGLALAVAAAFVLAVRVPKGTPGFTIPEPPTSPDLRALAATARNEAFVLCAQNYWVMCESQLDKAKKLDPSGEDDPRVKASRAAIAEGKSVKPFEGAKP